LVDAVTREWFRELREGGDYEVWELDELMSTFFAIFYVDDAYLASRDAEFLQRALDLLVSLFGRVGLETNVSKTQTMICTPGRIRTQLPADSYRRLRRGRVTAAEWNARDVECLKCGKMVKATSLRRHLADMHNVYQQTVVAEEMLIYRPAETYVVSEVVPDPRVRRLLERRLDDAATLSGRPPKGLSQGPKRGEISSVQEMWDAG
jgi:hypothetical protein